MRFLLQLLIDGFVARAGALLARRAQAANGVAANGAPGNPKQQDGSRVQD